MSLLPGGVPSRTSWSRLPRGRLPSSARCTCVCAAAVSEPRRIGVTAALHVSPYLSAGGKSAVRRWRAVFWSRCRPTLVRAPKKKQERRCCENMAHHECCCGGLCPQDVNSEDIQRIAAFATDQINMASNSMHPMTLHRVHSAHTQVSVCLSVCMARRLGLTGVRVFRSSPESTIT